MTATQARSLVNAPDGHIFTGPNWQYSTQPAACRLIPIYPDGLIGDRFTTTASAGCSGWLARDKTIVTNGHCMYKYIEEEDRYAQALSVIASCEGDTCEEAWWPSWIEATSYSMLPELVMQSIVS